MIQYGISIPSLYNLGDNEGQGAGIQTLEPEKPMGQKVPILDQKDKEVNLTRCQRTPLNLFAGVLKFSIVAPKAICGTTTLQSEAVIISCLWNKCLCLKAKK